MRNLRRIGVETINGQRKPVYEIPNRAGRFVEQDDQLLSVEGAKAFKRGQYPLHPSLRPVVTAELSGEPFVLRDPRAQTATAQKLLKATLSRLIDVGFPQVAA